MIILRKEQFLMLYIIMNFLCRVVNNGKLYEQL